MKKPCPNCEDFTSGREVKLDENHLCNKCGKKVRGPLMIYKPYSGDISEEHF